MVDLKHLVKTYRTKNSPLNLLQGELITKQIQDGKTNRDFLSIHHNNGKNLIEDEYIRQYYVEGSQLMDIEGNPKKPVLIEKPEDMIEKIDSDLVIQPSQRHKIMKMCKLVTPANSKAHNYFKNLDRSLTNKATNNTEHSYDPKYAIMSVLTTEEIQERSERKLAENSRLIEEVNVRANKYKFEKSKMNINENLSSVKSGGLANAMSSFSVDNRIISAFQKNAESQLRKAFLPKDPNLLVVFPLREGARNSASLNNKNRSDYQKRSIDEKNLHIQDSDISSQNSEKHPKYQFPGALEISDVTQSNEVDAGIHGLTMPDEIVGKHQNFGTKFLSESSDFQKNSYIDYQVISSRNKVQKKNCINSSSQHRVKRSLEVHSSKKRHDNHSFANENAISITRIGTKVTEKIEGEDYQNLPKINQASKESKYLYGDVDAFKYKRKLHSVHYLPIDYCLSKNNKLDQSSEKQGNETENKSKLDIMDQSKALPKIGQGNTVQYDSSKLILYNRCIKEIDNRIKKTKHRIEYLTKCKPLKRAAQKVILHASTNNGKNNRGNYCQEEILDAEIIKSPKGLSGGGSPKNGTLGNIVKAEPFVNDVAEMPDKNELSQNNSEQKDPVNDVVEMPDKNELSQNNSEQKDPVNDFAEMPAKNEFNQNNPEQNDPVNDFVEMPAQNELSQNNSEQKDPFGI